MATNRITHAAFLNDLAATMSDNRFEAAGDHVTARPRSTAEVAAFVSCCARYNIAIVPVGGDTGLSGGTNLPANRPAARLSLDRMSAIRSVDPDRWTMTVEAGVTIEAIQDAATEAGRAFAPDWGARGTATIGGAISTDAGGTNVVRYGNMRENILGIEVVLADGTIWDGLRALRKDSSGYDLKQLFIGGEGTLGVVTAAVVRLVPATPHRATALVALAGLDQLAAFVEHVRTAATDTVTALELMSDEGIRTAADRFDLSHPLPGRASHHVLVSLSAGTPVTDALSELLKTAAEWGLISDAAVAVSADQESALWRFRELQSPTESRPEVVADSLKYDIAVPLDHVGALLHRSQAVVDESGTNARIHAFGHVGDGNIHLYVLAGADIEGFRSVRETVRTDIDDLVFELGGTLSAEHGVGTLLRDRVGPQKSAIEWELMRRVKDTFDPANLFNPEKMLPEVQSPT